MASDASEDQSDGKSELSAATSGQQGPANLPSAAASGSSKPIKADEELLQKFLVNQTEELRIKGTELELAKQKDNNGFEFAKASLAVQADDRRHQREVDSDNKRRTQRLILGIAGMVVATVLVALYLNKDEIAKEIIKAVVFVTVGFLGGFGAAKMKTPDKTPPPPKTLPGKSGA